MVFAGTGKLLYYSRDSGNTWALSGLSSGPNAVTWIKDLQIHPTNAKLRVAAALDARGGVLLTIDGGSSWRFKGTFQEGRVMALDWLDQKVIYLAPADADVPQGIAKSSDQGETWQWINNGLSDKTITAIAVDPQNGSNLFAGTASGKAFRSTNAGTSWKESGSGVDVEGIQDIEVDPANSNRIYIAGEAGQHS